MTLRPVASVAVLLALALGAAAETPVSFTLTAGQTEVVQMFGVTAAWSVDTAVVTVLAEGGRVNLSGRSAGRTTIIVVGATGEHHYEVVVNERHGQAPKERGRRADRATAEVRYSSAAREIQSSVSVTREGKDKRVEAGLRTVHAAGTPQGDRATTSIAGATYSVFTRGRELTFFDRQVDHSPLTLQSTPLRGIHYLDEHWHLHAGYTAYATYRSFLIPVERQLVTGGGYAFRAGRHATVTPGFFIVHGEGTVASLLYEYAEPDRLRITGELGYSRGFGGAAEISWNDTNDDVRAAVHYRPDDFTVAGTATPRGFFGDASWTHTYGRDSAASASASATQTMGMRVIAGAADIDHHLNDTVALTGGASWAAFDGRRTITVPAGVRLDLGRGQISALYRYTHGFNNEGGHGLRLAGRVALGRIHASAFVDRQRNAPTLDVIFSERPDLALALAELGIVATSPGDLARALREHAALAELGFIDGVTLQLAPVRTQMGLEAAWLGTSSSRHQLRARLLRNVTETVAARTTTLIASLAYSRRLSGTMDVFGSWSYWRTETAGGGSRVQPFIELGIRQRFDGLPAMFGGSGTISGVVFADDDLDGLSDGHGVAAEVELDGTHRQRTGEDGTFAFKGVGPGPHQVVASTPDKPEAYFTTASKQEASAGERVAFGVASTPARLLGRVVNDAGGAIAGVRLVIRRNALQHEAVSASDGRFAFAAAPGDWELSIVPDSLPAGHSIMEARPKPVTLDRTALVAVEAVLRVHRNIEGHAAAGAEIHVDPPGRIVRADGEGRFIVRSVPAGTVRVTSNGVTRHVDIPPHPATTDVDLREPSTRTIIAAKPAPSLRGAGHVVQIGAYRVHDNAMTVAAKARAAGVEVVTEQSGTWTFVRAKPAATREAAETIAVVLRRAGLDAIVMKAR